MWIQYALVGAILAACVAYAIGRVKKVLNQKSGDPCYGCQLRDYCGKADKTGECLTKREKKG